jgi:hypothetical protein
MHPLLHLSTAQILSYNDLLFYVILNLANTISKLPEDGVEAPKHAGAFVI